VVIAVLFLLLALAAGFFFYKWIQIKKNPDQATRETSKVVISEVGKIYELPTSEEPTVAKVQDKEKLKNQQFFNSSQNGDYILIYPNSKLALIYRQETKKLVNVGPIALGADQTEPNQVEVAQ